MLPIYQDNSPETVIKKSRKMAVSEYAINWLFWNLDCHPYTTALHIFPNDSQSKKFSKTRILPDMFKDIQIADPKRTDNVTHKTLPNGSHYILSFIGGVHSKSTDARSLSADFLVLDEAKDLPQKEIADVEECLSLSNYKYKRVIGTPDFPNTDFEKRWLNSDQHEWCLVCDNCSLIQPLTFDNIIDKPTQHSFACTKCNQPLNRLTGQWIPQNPEGKTRGYHVTQLMANWWSADQIIEKKNLPQYSPQKFNNEVLGLDYSGENRPITIPKLLACKIKDPAEWVSNPTKTGIGIDWGNTSFYIVLHSANDTFYIQDFGRMEEENIMKHAEATSKLLNRYQGACAVLDSGYGRAQNQSLFDEHPTRAYECIYSSEKDTEPHWSITPTAQNQFKYQVHMNHQATCEAAVQLINLQKIKIYIPEECKLSTGSKLRDLLENLCLVDVRTVETNAGLKRKWNITPAHYFAALCFAYLATQKQQDSDWRNVGGRMH